MRRPLLIAAILAPASPLAAGPIHDRPYPAPTALSAAATLAARLPLYHVITADGLTLTGGE